MALTANYRKYHSGNPLQRRFLERLLTQIIRQARIIHPRSVLDAGCGEGFLLDRLKHAGIGVKNIGVDLSEDALAIAKKERPDLSLKKADLYSLPFKDSSFDLVLCCEVFQHLKDPKKALKELHRVAKQYVIFSVPNEPLFKTANFMRGKHVLNFGDDASHLNHWSGDSFEEFVSKYFTVFTRKQPFPWTILVGEKR